MMRVEPFRLWLPPILWAGLILYFSGNTASSGQTSSALRELFRWLSDGQFDALHFVIRKGAHFVEYGVLGALSFRAAREGRAGWEGRWGAVAVGLAAVVATMDETRQSLFTSRSGSAWDVLLDTSSAAVTVLLWRLRYPSRS